MWWEKNAGSGLFAVYSVSVYFILSQTFDVGGS